MFHVGGWYGIAALMWWTSGLLRAFGGLEKGTEHYPQNHWSIRKMTLFGRVVPLELFPMITMIY